MAEQAASGKGLPGYWFSPNPDKAWGEKFFLTVVPFWFFYNMAMVQMGWLNTGTFWNIMQNVLVQVQCIHVLVDFPGHLFPHRVLFRGSGPALSF